MKGAASLFKETRTYDQAAKKYLCYQTVICSECGAFENHPVKGSRPLPPEPLIKVFQRRGWVMGATRKHDICPDCISDAAETKRREAEKRGKLALEDFPSPPVTTAQVIALPQKKDEPAVKPAENVTQMPRTPTREDKRLIILEIENHYLGPDKGYNPGSSDETVAKGLNVPLKWVADLREEFFGPLVNPEIAKLTADVMELASRIDLHEARGQELRSKLNDLKERLVKATAGGR